jgi:G3E family GTPase
MAERTMIQVTLDQPIVVDVLTGFLGAGKTTLLSRLLDAGVLEGVAVLVNEFAALPIDHQLLIETGAPTEVFVNGCLCCATSNGLRAGLVQLLERRAAGTVAPFTRILIETSGIADPTPIARVVCTDPLLSRRMRMGKIVSVVDLLHVAETLDDHNEALAQIVSSDHILLSKGDLISPEQRRAAIAAIDRLNLLASVRDLHAENSIVDPWLEAIGSQRYGAPRSLLAAPGEVLRIHHALNATALRWPSPVNWASFAAWLSLLLHRHGAKILRVKGLLRVAGNEGQGPVVIQAVRHVVYTPRHLTTGGDVRGLEVVVITRDIDPQRISRSFAAFMSSAGRANGYGHLRVAMGGV